MELHAGQFKALEDHFQKAGVHCMLARQPDHNCGDARIHLICRVSPTRAIAV
jgi:hypothetical protein